MKTLKSIGMTLLAVVFCINITSCSDDDNENNKGALAGTTWKIISISNNTEDYDDMLNMTTTFNTDGTVTFRPNPGWGYTRWTLNGNILRIIVGERNADDYMEGTLSINGNSATWDFYWADVDGEWNEKDEPHTIIHLQKQ